MAEKETVDVKINKLIQRVDDLNLEMTRVHKKLRKKVEQQKLRLTEKFRIHDYMKSQEARFEALTTNLPLAPYKGGTLMLQVDTLQELRAIINNLCKTVDTALGVKYP